LHRVELASANLLAQNSLGLGIITLMQNAGTPRLRRSFAWHHGRFDVFPPP
jgi:hypothetical protein